jgi:hypothetical protein
MIRYPPNAARAIGFLKRSRNTFEIYVEDTSRNDQWTAYVKSCLPVGTKISSVIPVGSRNEVIKLCAKDQALDGRKKLYIIDADFDYVLGIRKPNIKHLYRIPFSNLEAAFAQPHLVGSLSAVFHPNSTATQEKTIFVSFINGIWGKWIRKLWIYYALNHKLNAGCVTCKSHVSGFTIAGRSPWDPSVTALLTKANEIRGSVFGKSNVRQETVKIKSRISSLPIEKIASGKTYLLPLAVNWVRSRAGIQIPEAKMMMMLADKSTKPLDARLANRLSRM